MIPAKLHIIQGAAQGFQHFVDDDFLRGFRQHVTSLVPWRAVDKTIDAQNSCQLRYIMRTDPLGFAQLRNAHAVLIATTGYAQQNAQAVFFLCGYFHIAIYRSRSPSFTWYLSSI